MDLFTAPEKSAVAGNTIVLTEALSPGAGFRPGVKNAYSPEGEKSSSLSPVKSGGTKQVAPSAGSAVEIQEQPEQPAAIIRVGSPRGEITSNPNAPSDTSTPWDERPELELMLDSLELADGTAVAQQDVTMKTAAKKTNISGATEQKLPVAFAPVISENLPVRLDRAGAQTPTKNRNELVSATFAGIPASAAATKTVLPEALNLPRLATTGAPLFERTQEMVALQSMRLREAGADELRVVIKPDNGTQLSLNLQQRNGVVEVQAVLDRGNFDLLNRHWPELQQQLEARGVRVAPLSGAEHTFGGGSEGFRQPTTPNGQHAGDDVELAETPVTLIPGLPTATATASASATLARNWETWA
jgi:hypothetical protein